MSTTTTIEWTQVTWNPTTGCDRISPGCDHCYALTLAARLKAMGQAKYQTDGHPPTSGPGFGVAVHAKALAEPLGWRRPRLIFVNSMSDLFHARVPEPVIASVFAVMAAADQHTYQVLTKRPARMARLLAAEAFGARVAAALRQLPRQRDGLGLGWPLPNVWLGASIETDAYCWRADRLRQTPAAVRFLSLEPLLGPLPSLDLTGIGWVICGGESGPGHRPVDPAWVRELRDRCIALGVPFFFKQWGGPTPRPAAGCWTGAPGTSTPRHGQAPPGDPARSSASPGRLRRRVAVHRRRRPGPRA
jgi:protein gp37